jgi:predicted RNA binding protein YcfA (HicA-like mRNA interferase family)
VSSHFPNLKSRDIIRLLVQNGFQEERVTGSHHIFRHPISKKIVTVPIHGGKDIKTGTLKSIFRQAGIDWRLLTKK